MLKIFKYLLALSLILLLSGMYGSVLAMSITQECDSCCCDCCKMDGPAGISVIEMDDSCMCGTELAEMPDFFPVLPIVKPSVRSVTPVTQPDAADSVVYGISGLTYTRSYPLKHPPEPPGPQAEIYLLNFSLLI